MISTFTYTADRDTRIDFSTRVLQGDGPLLVKNDGAVQKLSDIAGKRVATTSGSVYDRWMKNCFKNTEVVVADTFTNAMLAFKPGPRRRGHVRRRRPAAGRGRRPHREADGQTSSSQAPFGIGIKQGNTALKAWVDSRLDLMRKKDQFFPILKANVPRAVPELVLEEHPAAEQHVHVRVADGAERGHRLPVADPGGGGPAAASRLRSTSMLFATYDFWAFVSENWDELWQGFLNTLKVSALAIAGAFVIGLVLGAARAHRIPVVSQLTAIYVEVIRNTPILVLIFMIFYGLPELGIMLDAFTVAWVSVMLWGGAFNSENFRAGFLAVSHRHREAALRARLPPVRRRS